ncbi:CBS domain-containing protein, partial [Chloroflexota bacterium]
IRDLLKTKDRPLITIGPNGTVSAAIQKLVEHDRGSIPVCNENGELVGIITERDIVRKSFVRSDALANIKVEEVMTKEVAIGTSEDDLDYAVSVMKQKRIRHLPIVDSQKVVGMVSMRDLLDVQLNEAKTEIRYAGLVHKRPQRPVV